jgi:hypothetical protein
MRPSLRPWYLLALTPFLNCVLGAGSLTACSTDPVNPDGCEKIEFARCQMAPACEAFGADFDVDACERFYRDQCLKGLQTENDPGDPKIDACVRAIEKAGDCARKGISPCNIGTREIEDTCNVIVAPEQYDECGFLDDYFEDDAGLTPFPEAGSDASPDAGSDASSEAPLDEAG